MEFKATQIAEILGGTIEGNPEAVVNHLSKIEEGEDKSLSFLANPKYTPFIYTTGASIVLVNNDFVAEKEIPATLIRVEDSYQSFAQLLNYVQSLKVEKKGIEQPSYIHETATVGEDVYVGAFAYIGKNVTIGNNVKINPQVHVGDNVIIGDGTVIYAGVKIYEDCIIGKQCTIHSGAVIGADGFGFAPNSDNEYNKIAQIGNVILKDKVEIGANTTIDRATMGSTIIREGAKLDNLIQIAHNVEIGKNTVIAAQTGIAGSTKVGDNCMFGGQVGVIGHLVIADDVKVAAQSGISGSVKKAGSVIQGTPSFNMVDYKRSYIYFKKLPALVERINQLEGK